MKVKFEKEDKKYFMIAEAPIVRKIIQDMKETEESAADTVEYAMHAMEVWENYEVLRASAKISHNCRVYNYFSDDSGTIDIWIEATVETDSAFYKIGYYFTDAWSVSSDNHADIVSHMYIRCFKEIA